LAVEGCAGRDAPAIGPLEECWPEPAIGVASGRGRQRTESGTMEEDGR
jgi:hypothetical protein